jgi:hypothetical protein
VDLFVAKSGVKLAHREIKAPFGPYQYPKSGAFDTEVKEEMIFLHL